MRHRTCPNPRCNPSCRTCNGRGIIKKRDVKKSGAHRFIPVITPFRRRPRSLTPAIVAAVTIARLLQVMDFNPKRHPI